MVYDGGRYNPADPANTWPGSDQTLRGSEQLPWQDGNGGGYQAPPTALPPPVYPAGYGVQPGQPTPGEYLTGTVYDPRTATGSYAGHGRAGHPLALPPPSPPVPGQAGYPQAGYPGHDASVPELLAATLTAAAKSGRRHRIPGPWWAKLIVWLVGLALLVKIVVLPILGGLGIHVSFPWSHLHSPVQSVTTYQDVGPEILQAVVKERSFGSGTQYIPINRTVTQCQRIIVGCATIHTITYKATGVAEAPVEVQGDPGVYWDSPYQGHQQHSWGQVVRQPNGQTPGLVNITMVLPAPHLPQNLQDLHLLADKTTGQTVYVLNSTQGGYLGHGIVGGWGKISHDVLEPDALKFTLSQVQRPEVRQQLIASAEDTARTDLVAIVKSALQVAHFNANVTVLFSPN